MGLLMTARGADAARAGTAEQYAMPPLVDSRVVEPCQRLNYWKNHVNRFNGVDIVCGTEDFVGRIRTRLFGEIAIHDVNIATPHRAIRRKSQKDLCFVSVQLAKSGGRFNGPREREFAQGTMLIYQASDGYELDFSGASESLVIALPKSLLQRRVSDLGAHLEEPVDYDSQKVQMLASLTRGMMQSNPNAPQAVEDALVEALLNLLTGTIYDSRVATNRPATYGASAMLQRIKTYLNDNIDDPNLNPVAVAEALGITVSYLHKVFLNSQITLMQYVLTERLERCRRDLAKSGDCGSISHVAYRWGFNDASHFSRSFRKRFGESPREYRKKIISRHRELVEVTGKA